MSDIKFTKKSIKSPDKLQLELRRGFQWSAKHSKAVALAILAFLALGGAIAGKSWLDQKKENEIQAQYFKVEKNLLDKKAAFAVSDEKSKATLGESAKKDSKNYKKSNQAAQKIQPESLTGKSTGDLATDYGTCQRTLCKL